MKLYYNKRLKDPTYYAQITVRSGTKVSSRNIKCFGKHSELLQITEDPLAYCQEEIRRMDEEYRAGRVSLTLTTDFNEKVEHSEQASSSATWVNIGYFVLQDVMKRLQLKEFFRQKTADPETAGDWYTIDRFLTYRKVFASGREYAPWSDLTTYYEQPQFDNSQLLQFVDVLADHHLEYLSWLYQHCNVKFPKDAAYYYYDCSDFYLEWEQGQEKILDPVTGESLPGEHALGVKKSRPSGPVAEMGLLMDSRSIPITMCLRPENLPDTVMPLQEMVRQVEQESRLVYCGAGGPESRGFVQYRRMGGQLFVLTLSGRDLPDSLQEAVLQDSGYRNLSDDAPITLNEMKTFDRFRGENLDRYNDFACKVLPAPELAESGPDGGEPRLLVLFSRKRMEYQRRMRERQIQRAMELLHGDAGNTAEEESGEVLHYLKQVSSDEPDGAARYQLDRETIAEEEQWDGFYLVLTNLQDPEHDILHQCHLRFQVEKFFRIINANATKGSVQHLLEKGIQAHFLICYTALLVYRLLQVELENQGTAVTGKDLIHTLKNMNVINVHDVEYMALYKGSQALDALDQLTGLELDRKHYKLRELNGKIKNLLW